MTVSGRSSRRVLGCPLSSPGPREPDRHPSLEATLARLPRYAAPGAAQHVIQRGNNRSVMFAVPADYRFLHRCLREACEEHGCRVHAYVLMTNHIHLLITATTADGVSRVMQTVGRRYV